MGYFAAFAIGLGIGGVLMFIACSVIQICRRFD